MPIIPRPNTSQAKLSMCRAVLPKRGESRSGAMHASEQGWVGRNPDEWGSATAPCPRSHAVTNALNWKPSR
jgi:hypothetical protein